MDYDDVDLGSVAVGTVQAMWEDLQGASLIAGDVAIRFAELEAHMERLVKGVPEDANLWNARSDFPLKNPASAEYWEGELLFGTSTSCYLCRGTFLPAKVGGEMGRQVRLSYVSVTKSPIPERVEAEYPLHRKQSSVHMSSDLDMIRIVLPHHSAVESVFHLVRNENLLAWLVGDRKETWSPDALEEE